MATVLDLGLLHYLLPVFSFLFIFSISYALLDKFKLIGDSVTVKSTASFAMAILFLFSGSAMEFVNFITPWFIVLIVVAFFLLALFTFMGVKNENWPKVIADVRVHWTIIIIVIILLFISIGHVFGGVFSPYDDEDTDKTPESEGLKAIVHPRVLGAIFILIIASFAVKFISNQMAPRD